MSQWKRTLFFIPHFPSVVISFFPLPCFIKNVLKIFFLKTYFIFLLSFFTRASQIVLVVKNLPTNVGDIRDSGSIPGSGRSPGEGNGDPLQYSCLGKSHAQGSLVHCSPWGNKELDTTEPACTSFFTNLKKNWNIIALQCWVNVFCTMKWISYIQTYLLALLHVPPPQVITEHQDELPALHSSFLCRA